MISSLGDIMASIKDQKLDLYRKVLAMQDRGHLVIRYGTNKELIDAEMAKLAPIYEALLSVPKQYTLPKLKAMLGCYP